MTEPTLAHQPCAPFATCAEPECSSDAVQEVLHHPGVLRVWVPFCARHFALLGRERVWYVVDLHGFIPVIAPARTPS